MRFIRGKAGQTTAASQPKAVRAAMISTPAWPRSVESIFLKRIDGEPIAKLAAAAEITSRAAVGSRSRLSVLMAMTVESASLWPGARASRNERRHHRHPLGRPRRENSRAPPLSPEPSLHAYGAL